MKSNHTLLYVQQLPSLTSVLKQLCSFFPSFYRKKEVLNLLFDQLRQLENLLALHWDKENLVTKTLFFRNGPYHSLNVGLFVCLFVLQTGNSQRSTSPPSSGDGCGTLYSLCLWFGFLCQWHRSQIKAAETCVSHSSSASWEDPAHIQAVVLTKMSINKSGLLIAQTSSTSFETGPLDNEAKDSSRCRKETRVLLQAVQQMHQLYVWLMDAPHR